MIVHLRSFSRLITKQSLYLGERAHSPFKWTTC